MEITATQKGGQRKEMMPSLNGNWVDLVIIIVIIYYAIQAWEVGFWAILTDFLSFLGSLLISLRVYKFAAQFLRSNFSLSHSVSNALGFLLTAVALEILLGYLFAYLISKLPEKLTKTKWNRILAIVFGVGEGVILIAFILTLILGLPINPSLKKDVTESKIGSYILKSTSGIEKKVNEIFGGVVEDSLTSLTIKPGSREKVSLNVGKSELKVDEAAEAEMFRLVNKAREDNGFPDLTWTPSIVAVARAYAMDMWSRHYFSHYSPEGKDVGDRLTAAGIGYTIAGENLALAPTTQTAFNGLMNSPGHRANILEPKFHKVGIGAVDNGVYGIIFVQVFTD